MPPADKIGRTDSRRAVRDRDAEALTEQRLHDLLDNLPNCIARFDRECRYVFVSTAVTRLFGIPAEQIIGRRISETAKSGDDVQNARLENLIKQAFEEGHANSGEAKWITAEGERFFEILNVPERDEDGRIVSVLGIAHDITKRKVAEQALYENEFFLHALLDAMPLPVFYKDRQGQYLGVNRAFEEFFGTAREQMVGKSVFDISPRKLADVYFAKDNELFEGGGVQRYESQVRGTQGDLRDVIFNKATFTDSQRDIKGLIGVILDITERKQAEDELRASEARFRTFADHAMDAFFLHGENGIVLDANFQACASLGYSRDELIGMNPGEFDVDFPPESRDAFRARMDKGEIVTFSSHHRRKDGSVFPVEVRMRPFLDGDPRRYISTVRDLTERQRAEVDMHRLNLELRAISLCHQTMLRANDEQGLLDDICRIICDVADYSLAWVGYVEHDEAKAISVKAVAGYDHGYIESAIRSRLTWSEDTEHGRGPAAEAIRSGKIVYVQDIATDPRMVLWRERALERGYHSCIALPLKDDQASVFGVMMVYSDRVGGINRDDIRLMDELSRDLAFGIDVLRTRQERLQAERERERLQGQLLQAQKMESVGRLAGGIAHDFNNMLAAIMGYAELALQGVDPTQRLFMDLQEIRKAASRSADLTRQLLAFARKQPTVPAVLDLNKTVEGMLKMLRRLIGEDIQLNWLPGRELHPVRVDPSQIDQILANLCVNARDAIENVGSITIETRNVRLDRAYCADHPWAKMGDYVLLAVCDDGRGMDEETLGKVFEPFFTTKGVGQGTGLGLAMVYGIVKQNGGFIDIRSRPGRGTSVEIQLPQHASDDDVMKTLEEVKEPETMSRGHETILLVEDEPQVLEMTKLMLEEGGYRVLEASTPDKAIRVADEHAGQIRLMVTDVVMPGMNGHDLSVQLTSQYPGIKTLFMSGYPGNAIKKFGMPEHPVNFIQKPFSASALTTMVRRVLDSE